MKHEFLRRTGRTALGLALSLTMAASLLPGVALAEEADGAEAATGAVKVENKYLGVDIMAKPASPDASKAWSGSYVYFGEKYQNSKISGDIRYRVLTTNTTAYADGKTTVLLDSDYIVDGWGAQMPKQWKEIGLDNKEDGTEGWLDGTFYKSKLTTQEQAVVPASTYDSDFLNDHSLQNQHVFVLGEELMTTAYGYSYNNWNGALNRQKGELSGVGGKLVYWNRYFHNSLSITYNKAYGSMTVGQIAHLNSSTQWVPAGVSPAMNVDTAKILFTNYLTPTTAAAAEGEEATTPAAAGALGAEYKLTIIDDALTVNEQPTVERTEDTESTLAVTYTLSGDNKANATKVGLMVLTKEYTAGGMKNTDMVDYYEVPVASAVTAADAEAGESTVNFKLDQEYDTTSHYFYLVAVDENEDKRTDYASQPVKLIVPAEQQAQYTIQLKNGNATTTDVEKFKDQGVEATTIFTYYNYNLRDSGYTVTDVDGNEVDSETVKRQYRVKGEENWTEMPDFSDSESLDIFKMDSKTDYSKIYEVRYMLEDNEESAVTRLVVVVYLKGDVDRNGRINASDSTAIDLHLVDSVNLELSDEFYKGKTVDVNGDGKINSNDSQTIDMHAMGLSDIVQDYHSEKDSNKKDIVIVKEGNN